MASDGAGGQTETWAPAGETWGAIDPASSRHGFTGVREGTTISHIVTIRHVALNGADRLTLGARTFRIVGVRNTEERDRELVLAVEEVAQVAA
jgi:SPP1 family predicted phage head-tail adaptor